MTHFLSFKLCIFIFISTQFVGLAQKPDKTHNHDKFVKKVVFAMGVDITKWSPDEVALKFMSKEQNKTMDELSKLNEEHKNQLKKDVEFLNNENIYRNYSSVTLENINKEPTISDIILHCEMDGKPYTITLKNCIQTNISWYLGDRIIASGEWIDLMKKKVEPVESEKKGLITKLEEINETNQSKNPTLNEYAYVGKKFPMQGTDAHTQFYKMNLIGQFLEGYIIDNHDMKQEVKIRYDTPEFLNNPNKNLTIQSDDGITSELEKNLVKAFYVGDQLFVFTGEFWDILLREGAIRQLGRVIKDSEGNYLTADLIQKQGMSPENMISLSLGFKNKMSEYVLENEELADKVKNKDEGYKYRNIDIIISEYNQWYDDNYPNKVEYLFKSHNTDVQSESKEKLAQDIFIALKSKNPENFRPYLFTKEDIENSSIKSEIKNKMLSEFNTDPKKSKSEWYGLKGNVLDLVDEFKLIADKSIEIEKIEFKENGRESKEVGVEVSEAKTYLQIGGQNGYYYRLTLAKLSGEWKVVEIRGNIVNLNNPPEESVEEAAEESVINESVEEAEEAEGDN